MKLTETKLSASIKTGSFENLYFIYGKEPFLITMYVDRIIKKAVGDDANDFNLQRLEGIPDTDMLSEYIEALPVFTEYKVITVKDFDPDKCDAETFKRYLDIIADVPDTTILVFYCTGVEIDDKKPKANTKKFLAAAEKSGAVCSIDMMKPPKIAELCVKKAAKEGIVFSPEDALYMTERVGGRMNVASEETAKLMNRVGKGGTITRADIDILTPKQLDAKVFDLADAINAGDRRRAYGMITDLFDEQIKAEMIFASLSGAYIDMYGAKLANTGGMAPEQAAQMLGYYGNRTWAFTKKILPAAAKLPTGYLRETVDILSDADITLKSTAVSKQTVIEEAVTRLFMCREKRQV